MEDKRKNQLGDWVNKQIQQSFAKLVSVDGDAGFRRYFRVQIEGQSFIAVDAPPANEDSELFARVAAFFRAAGVMAPKIYAHNFDAGFMLLEDFGDRVYLPRLLELQGDNPGALANAEADKLYKSAIHSLIKIQSSVDKKRLAPYDREKLHSEMKLFEDWFCQKYLGLYLTDGDRSTIAAAFNFLEDSVVNQPQVAVHRDYHSRNLLLLDPSLHPAEVGPGIIDFQDAMCGAYTYDLASLLRDCYIGWSAEQVEKWSLYYFDLADKAGLIAGVSVEQFGRDLDLAGLQRNFKVMGIFSRLCIRDNKPQYLADIPLVIQYFLEVACKYEEMAPFLDWFKENVLPTATSKLNLEL